MSYNDSVTLLLRTSVFKFHVMNLTRHKRAEPGLFVEHIWFNQIPMGEEKVRLASVRETYL